MTYNWQLSDWPNFSYSSNGLEDLLYRYAEQVGLVSGSLNALPHSVQTDSIIQLMVAEAVKTSEIEGEYVNRQDVMSSIRNHLGVNAIPETIKDARAQGAAQLMIDVRKTFAQSLSQKKLFAWHQMLLGEAVEIKKMSVGRWRAHQEPIQVVSGMPGRPKVHFEGPKSVDVPVEMKRFITWFNQTAPGKPGQIRPGPIRAAIAHLYFESIHPFEDGNGRIGRALIEKALSQDLGRPVLISVSQAIEANKKAYYSALEAGQKNNEISEWLKYFIKVLLDAQTKALEEIKFILCKARFFDAHVGEINGRQEKVIKRMLREGLQGFIGGMNARKYMAIAQCSKATATRDIRLLVGIGVFEKGTASGRSTYYELIML